MSCPDIQTLQGAAPEDSPPGPFEMAVSLLYEEINLERVLPKKALRLAMIGLYN